jgi:DNA topoisomerase-1
MKLVIVESPSKAKTINKYLGKDFKVLASYGHIRELPSKNGSVEPEKDFEMHYETDADPKRLKDLTTSAKDADEIILATDPDREGESISWHVLEMLREKKVLKKQKVSRVVFNAITKNAVLEAMKKPREVDMDLVNAQQARRALDYLVGFTLSPVLWRKLPGARSAGRVQSVALRLICDREAEIEAFVSEEYWDIRSILSNGIAARLTHVEGKKLDKFDIPNAAKAASIKAKIEGQKVNVIDTAEKEVRRSPKPPFITSTLQQEAARKLGYTAKRTMQLAQKLYEGVNEEGGLITYMRTDGVYVAPEAVTATRELIESRFGKRYLPAAAKTYTSKAINSQEAHEAIRPTDVARTPDSLKGLDEDMHALYDLIWKRMIASQMEQAVFDQATIDFETTDKYAILRANGSVLKFDGYQKVYEEGSDDEENEEEKRLPKVSKGESHVIKEVKDEQHFTEAPPRYSEASLVKKLEEMGIGRPSTYASIISVLQDRQYVKIDKKRFIPEDRGRIVTVFLANFFKKYVEFDYTAKLEESLDEVSEGRMDWKQVLRNFWGDFNAKIKEASDLKIQDVLERLNEALEKHVFPNGRKCPSCADGILGIRLSKFGSFIGCSNYPTCSYTAKMNYDAVEGEALETANEEPKPLGTDPDTGLEITLRKGPYGFYVQLGEETEEPKKSGKGTKKIKPKRFTIAKTIDPETVTLEQAIDFLKLPRLVGIHPETGKEIKAGIGRFGPYLLHNDKFTSLKTDDVLTVGINRAVDVLANAGAKSFGLIRELGEFDGQKVELSRGRFGAYIKYGKLNVALPKGTNHEELTLEDATALIKKKKDK